MKQQNMKSEMKQQIKQNVRAKSLKESKRSTEELKPEKNKHRELKCLNSIIIRGKHV